MSSAEGGSGQVLKGKDRGPRVEEHKHPKFYAACVYCVRAIKIY